ncbi:Lrp/AsnC family transcriptional regulator [Aliiruegeria sabulilitoris]|uniref:Lrp/AsnC family transcriptional regulator n=1 Tax=Aliiruegeria sabulilitoris TaxID=1510458 RepID=UPI00082DCE8D|nr:Lrp/AsnC family transcriptional regulator [Aliiruegeria sabulilitoris]NDR59364.1 Lrp/AsnC family transcriptional regulator [Pseudoruegeria sp. M32A2M]
MDDLDKTLLSALAADSSTPISQLARQAGVARSTVQARIERLQHSGVIAGYTIRLGEPAERRRIRATVLLHVEPRSAAALVQRLKAMPEVEACHSTTGRVDLILQLVAETTGELDEALDRIGAIPGVRDTESLIHLSSKFDRRT